MKNYIFVPTKNPDLFRVQDRLGHVDRYWRKSSDQYFSDIDEVLAEGYKDIDARDDSMDEQVLDLNATIETVLSVESEVVHLQQTESEHVLFEPYQWDAMVGFANFFERHEPILCASTAVLYNSMFKYAGTAAAILILTKDCGSPETCPCKDLIDKIGLFNWQFDEPHPTDIAKLCSLSVSDNISEYIPPLSSLGYTAILTLSASGATLQPYRFSSFTPDEMTDAWPRFIGALRIFEFVTTPFDPEKDIEEIPDEVNIVLRRFDFKKAEKEAAKLAKKKPHVATVRPLDIDASKVKVGVWIIAVTGENAEITELEDDGTVHYKTVSGKEEASHYTTIRHIYDGNPMDDVAGGVDSPDLSAEPTGKRHINKKKKA